MISFFLHEMVARSFKTKRACWNFLRKIYISFLNDPASKIVINGKTLMLPLSHQLPIYLSEHSEYDKLIGRVSKWIRKDCKSICFVDVGANIGDSVAQFNPLNLDLVIAVEPNEKFYSFLLMNYGSQNNIKIIKSICSSKTEDLNLSFDEKNGTASLVNIESLEIQSTTTIDSLLSHIINDKSIIFIKVDTDGFDFEVLKGAKSTISSDNPIVMFECDIFNNKEYINDINQILDLFQSCAYSEFLAYDNYGHLVGKYSISDRNWFLQLINYQCSGGIQYFDLLFIKDGQLTDFYKSELQHQALITKDKTARHAVEAAGGILSAHLV